MKHLLTLLAALLSLLCTRDLFADTSIQALTPQVVQTSLSARQLEWKNASDAAKKLIAEKIGEEGAACWAREQGYEAILDHTQKQYRHGVDQVYRAPNGNIVVIEAKGGTSPLRTTTDGLVQGTPESAVKSGKRFYNSPSATALEKQAGEQILQAARDGRLETVAIHTEHVQGEPLAPKVMEGRHYTPSHTKAKEAQKLAAEALEEISSKAGAALEAADKGALKAAQEVLQTVESVDGMKYVRAAAKVAGPVLAAVEVASRGNHAYQTEQAFDHGEISSEERLRDHAENGAGMVGGLAGAAYGATQGAALGATLGSTVPIVGTAVCGIVGGLIGGVSGYMAGEAAGIVGADLIVDHRDIVLGGPNVESLALEPLR